MRQQALRKERTNRPVMRVVKGLKDTQTELAPLVNTAWNFAYSSLWNCTQFSQKEIDTAKENIEEYLRLQSILKKHFPFSAKGYCLPGIISVRTAAAMYHCHPYGLTAQTKMDLPVRKPGMMRSER